MTEFQGFGDLFATTEKKQGFMDLDGTLWLNADVLCKKLGFKNTARSVAAYTEEDERGKVNVGALSDAWFVSESGTWGLILASKSPEAKALRKRLSREVLPSIRKNGYYLDPNATRSQLEQLCEETRKHRSWEDDRLEDREYRAKFGFPG